MKKLNFRRLRSLPELVRGRTDLNPGLISEPVLQMSI